MDKRTNLLNADNNIIGIKVETDKGTFTIPVVDVRINRDKVDRMIKDGNRNKGSKFFKPSYSWYGYSYNHSMKQF